MIQEEDAASVASDASTVIPDHPHGQQEKRQQLEQQQLLTELEQQALEQQQQPLQLEPQQLEEGLAQVELTREQLDLQLAQRLEQQLEQQLSGGRRGLQEDREDGAGQVEAESELAWADEAVLPADLPDMAGECKHTCCCWALLFCLTPYNVVNACKCSL